MGNDNNSQENNSKKDLGKYKDLSGLSDRHLSLGLWLAKNRQKMKQLIMIFLLVFIASTLSYSAYHYISYLLYGRAEHQTMLTELAGGSYSSEELRQLMAPQNLMFSFVRPFYVQGRHDLMAKIYNPNPRHRANFYYCFEEGGRELICGETFILPNEKKYVLELGQSIEGPLGAVNLVVKDISWQRISAHQIVDWEEYRDSRLNLEIDIKELKLTANNYNLQFSIENKSSYNFYEFPLQIILFSNNLESGANRYIVRSFMSGEKLDLSVTWPAGSERSSQAIIIPDVNILDKDVFIPYFGQVR